MAIHREDVVYGRKFGTALTLDVFSPESGGNGIGLIYTISGGWFASHDWIPTFAPPFAEPALARGYTVFAVVPSSQPKYSIPEIVPDMHRAVRYIRHNAAEFGIDPRRIGISGRSAGGHLSLMVGLEGGPGDPEAEDEIDRESSRVQAVAQFCGPTDFLNYGGPGIGGVAEGLLADIRAPFTFSELDTETGVFERVVDSEKIRDIAKRISPIEHATADAPPVLSVHGELDPRVPIQQAQVLTDKLSSLGAIAKLVTVPGGGHGWENDHVEFNLLMDWFDTYLK